MLYDLDFNKVVNAQVGDTLVSYDRHLDEYYIGHVDRVTNATLMLTVELPNGMRSARKEVVTKVTAKTRGGRSKRRWYFCNDPDKVREHNREQQRKKEEEKARREAAELARQAEARAANPKFESAALNEALGVYTTTMRTKKGAEAVVVYTVHDKEVMDDEFNYVPGKLIEPVMFVTDDWDGETTVRNCNSFRGRTVEEALFNLLVTQVWDR